MFGASALYHRLDQPEAKRRWLRRLDHAGVYALIAARTRRSACSCSKELAARGARIVWTGALAAILLKFVWLDAPQWLSAAIAVALGWVAVVAAPQLVDELGLAARSSFSPAAWPTPPRARLCVQASGSVPGLLRLP